MLKTFFLNPFPSINPLNKKNDAGIEASAVSLSWMIPAFLSTCNIVQINLLNEQCVIDFTNLYNEAVQLSTNMKAQAWESATLDLPQLYCFYQSVTTDCPFMQQYAWNPIPVSCACYNDGVQIFQDLQAIY